MNDFIAGQRWVSATEPELGLGIIVECDYNRVTVLFLACGEKRQYAKDNAPLTRVAFGPGDTVETNDNESFTVLEAVEKEGLISYLCADSRDEKKQLEEIDLNHHIQFNKPQDRFFTGNTDPGAWFNLRYETWRHIRRLQQSPVRGLSGGRTALLAHQLYIAHEAAGRYAPRIMLADEVGLGKTIEAGLIVHHRLINGLSRRILIIVPEALLYQWLVEMLRRFNLRFSIFDEERWAETHGGNPFLAEQLVLCSQSLFSGHALRAQQVSEAEWDMVVVDEAHHLQWDEMSPSPEYQLIEKLAGLTPALLLLTATPEQLGKKSHFARLRLLDPDRFYGFDRFLDEEKEFEPVARAARLLLEGRALDNGLKRTLKVLLQRDKVEALLERVADPDTASAATEELVNVLLDFHGTGRVLFRNSRQSIRGFPKRQRFAYELDAVDETQAPDLLSDPRFLWLVNKVAELGGEQALLICHEAQLAVELERNLKSRYGLRCTVFHEGMSIIERDRAAAYFADPESNVRLLICSEIGSEGRNFQFTHHLILFDLPVNPDLLQQRIGRLDRIGQRHSIQIHIPYTKHSAQHVLCRWYDEGLDVFLQNKSAAQRVYEMQKDELSELLQTYDPKKLSALIPKTRTLTEQIEAELHHGRDLLLELNSCRKETAQELIEQITDSQRENTLWPYMDALFDCYGVEVEYHSPDCQIITPGNHMRVTRFPYLPEDGFTITVNRDIALAREDLQFLTWEHPLVIAAMDLVLSGETGNAAISIIKHGNLAAGQYLLESLFVVECSAPSELQIGRFLPPIPIRVLLDQRHTDLSEQIAHDDFVTGTRPVDATQLSGFLADQRSNINKLLAAAENKAQQTMLALINHGCKNMLQIQSKEIRRLVRLKKLNPSIKQAEIDQQKDLTEAAYQHMQAAKLKLDAVRILITS